MATASSPNDTRNNLKFNIQMQIESFVMYKIGEFILNRLSLFLVVLFCKTMQKFEDKRLQKNLLNFKPNDEDILVFHLYPVTLLVEVHIMVYPLLHFKEFTRH